MEEVYRGNERAAQDIEKIRYDAGEVATYAEKLRELVAEINDNVDRFYRSHREYPRCRPPDQNSFVECRD